MTVTLTLTNEGLGNAGDEYDGMRQSVAYLYTCSPDVGRLTHHPSRTGLVRQAQVSRIQSSGAEPHRGYQAEGIDDRKSAILW